MKRRAFVFAAATLVIVGLTNPSVSHGQANRGTTTSGMFGQTTLGSTSGASPQSLGAGMTTGMSSNATQGGSGQNNTGMGSAANPSGAAGMQVLQRGGQTGFVGSSSSTIQNPFATGQRGQGNQNFNMLTQLMTQSQRNQFNQQQAQQAARNASQPQGQFRVPLRLGFQPTVIQPQTFSVIVSTRLTRIPGLSKVGPIEASLEGRTAVLRGTVATEADRQLAEGLALLEPEVMAVRNELVVGSPGTTVEALPQASAAASPSP
jgi:hypothetical protein